MRRIRVTQSNLEDRQKCEDELDAAVKRAKEARELAPPPHPTRDEMERRWRKGKHLADDAAAGAPPHQPPAEDLEPAAIEGPHGVFNPQPPPEDGAAAEEEHLDYFDEDEPGPSREGIAPLGALPQDDSQEVNEHGFTPTEDKMSTYRHPQATGARTSCGAMPMVGVPIVPQDAPSITATSGQFPVRDDCRTAVQDATTTWISD